MSVAIPAEARQIIDRLAAIDREQPQSDHRRAEDAIRLHCERLGIQPLPVRWVSDAEAGYLTAFHGVRSTERAAAMAAAESMALAAVSATAWATAESLTDAAAESVARSAWSGAWFAAWSAARTAARPADWSTAESMTESAVRSAMRSAAARAVGIKDPALERWIGIWLPFLEAAEAGLWLFRNGQSKAVRLPREFRFSESRVRIRRVGKDILLEPMVADPSEWFAAPGRVACECTVAEVRRE